MKYLYIDGKLQLAKENNISTMMQAFNYGTAAFEGMKAFYQKSKKNWYIFRPDEHYQRLKRSAAMIDIDFKYSQEDFVNAIRKVIIKNNPKSDVYIRPLLYKNEKGVGLVKPSGYGFSVFIEAKPIAYNKEYRCCFVSQRRPIDGSYSGKLTGNYLLSYLSYNEAKKRNFDVGILLSSNGYVSEASIMNLFFVRNNKLFTPSITCGPLAGITRKTIIQLAKEQLGMKVVEVKYRPRKLMDAQEIFFTGTGSGISLVRQLEKKKFNLKRKNRIAPQLLDIYNQVVYGKLTEYQDWLVPIR